MGRAKHKDAFKARRKGAQASALCWRIQSGKVRLLMVTSRRSKRWILPKGWLMEGLGPDGAAAIEAWEEAGARGKIRSKSLGSYRYRKEGEGKAKDVTCKVAVFPMKVKELDAKWPEMHQRKRRWVSRRKAAALVWEPELSRLLKQFDPRSL